MIEAVHTTYATWVFPGMAILGLLGVPTAVVGMITSRRRLVMLGQGAIGAHLIPALLSHAWPVGIAGVAVAIGGFLFGGKEIWRYVVWALLSFPVGIVYTLYMGIWAAYVMAKGL